MTFDQKNFYSFSFSSSLFFDEVREKEKELPKSWSKVMPFSLEKVPQAETYSLYLRKFLSVCFVQVKKGVFLSVDIKLLLKINQCWGYQG